MMIYSSTDMVYGGLLCSRKTTTLNPVIHPRTVYKRRILFNIDCASTLILSFSDFNTFI